MKTHHAFTGLAFGSGKRREKGKIGYNEDARIANPASRGC